MNRYSNAFSQSAHSERFHWSAALALGCSVRAVCRYGDYDAVFLHSKQKKSFK